MLKRDHQDAGQSHRRCTNFRDGVERNEPFFRDCFDNVAKVVTWISRKGNVFTRHQTIVQDFIAKKKIDCGAVMLKSEETRFVSQVSMTERVLHQKKVFKTTLPKDALFLE
jgi:hypothetical protein